MHVSVDQARDDEAAAHVHDGVSSIVPRFGTDLLDRVALEDQSLEGALHQRRASQCGPVSQYYPGGQQLTYF